jgi:crossover junction endodeoxyribonuclease RuvC
VIAAVGNRLSHIANGQISTDAKAPLSERLVVLDRALTDLILEHKPEAAAVEEVFVNTNPQSTLKLGQARGVCLLAAGRGGLIVGEYAARLVKKAIVGTGGAEKHQVQAMLKILLPGVQVVGADAADALAVAICHAHQMGSARRIG